MSNTDLQETIKETRALGIFKSDYEIQQLIEFLSEIKPNNVMEIGTHYSGMFYLLCRFSKYHGIKISVTFPRNDISLKDYTVRDEDIKKWNGDLHIIHGEPHDISIYRQVREVLQRKRIDVAVITGRTLFDDVRQDYIMYSCFVKKEGHIIVDGINNYESDVPEFWKTLEGEKIEFQDKEEPNGGFGIITNLGDVV